ncbi:AAA family ATPase [Streptomyces sp. NPDC021100]|uniref:AAA family ATPase n=1 Tax=Streptomyces sp. NPDC021100 TaxID=3365114 RepID=UPI0037A93874
MRDLRGAAPPRAELRCRAGDLLVVSGLPGAGKSTLIRRAVAALDGRGDPVRSVDSQDSRARLERRLRALPVRLPYGAYRPFARLVHYAHLWHALRSGASLVVHDCGQRGWVRRLLAREARRRGTSLHVLLLAVEPGTALAGQRARGRTVSRAAFGRHRRAMERLIAAAEAGRPPAGAASVVLLDRPAAAALRTITFEGRGAVGASVAPAAPRRSAGPPASGASAAPSAPAAPAAPSASGALSAPCAPSFSGPPTAPAVPVARRPPRPPAVPLPPADGEPAVKVRVRARRDRGENG